MSPALLSPTWNRAPAAQDVAGCFQLSKSILRLLLWSLLISFPAVLRSDPRSPTNASPDFSLLLPVWNPFYTVGVGAGFKDNLLLSHADREPSGFVSITGDFTLWRRPIDDGREFQWVVNAVDRRYWSDRRVDHEDWAFSRARYLHDLGAAWAWVTDLDLSYFDVAVDLTYVESVPLGAQLRGGSVGGLTGLRRKWDSGDWLQFNPLASRTWLSGGFDAYSEFGGALGYHHPYGHKSDWHADYSLRLRRYDRRGVVDLSGREQLETELRYLRHDVSWALRHYWDQRRRWRTTTKLSGLASFDNGSGYFSYWRAALTEQLEYQASHWSVRMEAGVAHYEFPRQRLVTGGEESRRRSDLVLGLRVERRLGRLVKLMLEYNWDGAVANDQLEAYGANTIQGGVALDF
ncbi:MAG: hypothetical protein JNN07_26060 [Verrucomicrobiales bacterium]|nr:hypothetical protein [Verrucomicrobiales bacterium]